MIKETEISKFFGKTKILKMASRGSPADEGRELFQLAMDLTNALIASNRNRRLFYEGGDKVRNFSIV